MLRELKSGPGGYIQRVENNYNYIVTKTTKKEW